MVIQARDVTLRLGTGDAAVDVLRGLSIDVPAGQRLAILGPSGSGKSSAMAVLSGMERATSGQVIVAGADFTRMDEDGLARARRGRIGIVLQAFHLIPTMTALENVAVPLELAGEADAQGRAKAELEVDLPDQRLASCESANVGADSLGQQRDGHLRRIPHTRGDDAVGERPQRMVRRQRLGIRDVEGSTADDVVLQRPHQIIGDDVPPAGDVDDPRV